MCRTSLIPTSLATSEMVSRQSSVIKVCTLLEHPDFCCWWPTGHCQLKFLPFLNRLYHSVICVTLISSLQKDGESCKLSLFEYHKIFCKIWCSTIVQHILLLCIKLKCNKHVLHTATHTHWLLASSWLVHKVIKVTWMYTRAYTH